MSLVRCQKAQSQGGGKVVAVISGNSAIYIPSGVSGKQCYIVCASWSPMSNFNWSGNISGVSQLADSVAANLITIPFASSQQCNQYKVFQGTLGNAGYVYAGVQCGAIVIMLKG